jgi:hypothetical protein
VATKVYSNKCKWCGVIVDSKKPVEICECCGSSDIASTSYVIEGELPKTHKEQKLEAELALKEKRRKQKKALLVTLGVGLAVAVGLLILL